MGKRRNLTQELGATGLNENHGWIRDDFLNEWSGAEKIKRINEMLRNSPIVAALRLSIEMPVRDIDWTFASDLGEDDPRLELLNTSLENLTHSWGDHVIEALLALFYGWSMFTVNYEVKNGRVLWRKFKMLGNDTIMRWLFEDDGGLTGMQQWPYLWPDPIPIERMILYRFRKTLGNPEGESILRPAWWPYYFAKNLQVTEAISYERMGSGYPVISLPEGADTTDSDNETTDMGKAKAVVRNVRIDDQNGVVEPHGWKFRFESPGASATLDFDKPISRYESRMLMAALAQFLMLGQGRVGAQALSQDQTDFFTMALNAVADIIAETFTKYAIPRLLALNGMDAEGISLEHSPVGDIDISIISQFLQQAGDKITWDEQDEVWLRSLARLPKKTSEQLAGQREEKQAGVRAMQEAILSRQQPPPKRDDNTAVFYATNDDRPPDETERTKQERVWYRTAKNFFDGQYSRIVKGVK